MSETLRARLEGLPKPVPDIAWKAQVRLCVRYRRLSAAGKKLPVVVARQAAIARETAAFLGVSDGRSRQRKSWTIFSFPAQSRERKTKVGNSRR